MNMVDYDMAERFSRIQCEIGDVVYIPPQFRVSGRLVLTLWWCKHFGFEHTDKLNYWKYTGKTKEGV